MFKSPGLVGRIGAGIAGLAASVQAAAAAAVTYLLQATFTGANQSLADGDALTEGTGSLTTVDSGSGTVTIASNELRLTGSATITETGVYGNAITRAAGKRFIATTNQSSNTTTSHKLGLWSSGTIADANRVARVGNVDGVAVAESYSPAGTAADTFTTGLAVSAAADRKFAICTGGFDSSAVPSASGDYGQFSFYYDGTNWNLVAASPDLNTATVYPGVQGSTSSAATSDIVDFIIPTAADTSVFQPAGYAFDTFTNTNGTLLTAHSASEAGFDWTVGVAFTSGRANLQITSNYVESDGNGTAGIVVTNVSLSDFFAHSTVELTNGNSTSLAGILYRSDGSDEDNYFITLIQGASQNPDFIMDERTSGSTTRRASANADPAAADNPLSVRCSGTTQELWVNGGSKLTYTSSVRQTETWVGVYCYRSTSGTVGAGRLKDFYVLPLTSATYNTAFDTSALTASGCDLYFDFDSMDDRTLANGDIIYGGYVEDGTLTVVDSSTGSVAVTSNELVVTPTATITETGVYSHGVARSVGSVLKATLNQSSNTTTTSKMGFFSSGTIADANRIYRLGNVDGVATWESFNPAGTAATNFVTGLATTAATDRDYAIVLGGFDSTGAASATGDYGAFGYYNDGTNWNLVAASPDLNTATMYVGIQGTTSAASTETWDDIKLPNSDTTVEAVFTPTGYALDTFTDSNGTALESHSAEAGLDWSTISYRPFSAGFEINNNSVRTSSGVGAWAIGNTPWNHSEFLIVGTVNLESTVAGCQVGFGGRATDGDNYYMGFITGSAGASDFYLEERTSGSTMFRASSNVDPASGDNSLAFRAQGTKLETWTGTAYLTYTSSLRQTATRINIFCNATTPNTGSIKHLAAFPLTSTTYDTALNAI